ASMSRFLPATSRAPLHAHSFPPRRSSDLRFSRGLAGAKRRQGRRLQPFVRCSYSHHTSHFSRVLRFRSSALAHAPNGLPSRNRRSEEHTSELQSRENLVCRLLLEKKEDYD